MERRTTALPEQLLDDLTRIVQSLDELSIDPESDDFTSGQIAKAVRALMPVVTGIKNTDADQLAAALEDHESTAATAAKKLADAEFLTDYLRQIPSILMAGFVRLGGLVFETSELGRDSDAATLTAICLVLKAVALALNGGENSQVGWTALEVWAGVREMTEDDPAANEWMERLSKTKPPMELLGGYRTT